MRIHHLNCCPMQPFGKRFINGTGGYFEPADLVTHCLLLETAVGLVLVDTGLGRSDLKDPARQGTMVNIVMNPQRSPDPTAVTRMDELGLDPRDVEHVFMTHLDMDHAGGLVDFPEATVHLLEDEYKTAQSPPLMERLRYRKRLWEHGPDWSVHNPDHVDWYGFRAIRPFSGEDLELLMVPLPGHSAGHCGIAVQQNEGWLFHCGDAYFDTREMDLEDPVCSPGLKLQQAMISHDNATRKETQKRLRKLKEDNPNIKLFCSHSPEEFDELSD